MGYQRIVDIVPCATWLFMHPIYSSLHLLTPTSQSIPLSPPVNSSIFLFHECNVFSLRTTLIDFFNFSLQLAFLSSLVSNLHVGSILQMSDCPQVSAGGDKEADWTFGKQYLGLVSLNFIVGCCW